MEFAVVLENEPALIPPLVARLQEAAARLGLFDTRAAELVGIALHEALINAIEHGNLELNSGLRRDEQSALHRLAARRCLWPPYRDRRVHLLVRLSCAAAVYVIRDEGPGFDPARLPDPTDPAQLESPSGRGSAPDSSVHGRGRFQRVREPDHAHQAAHDPSHAW